MNVVDLGCGHPAPRWENPDAPPPIKAEELRKQLMPGLEVVFGVPKQASFVPQIKPKKGDGE